MHVNNLATIQDGGGKAHTNQANIILKWYTN